MPFDIPDIGASTFPCIDGKFMLEGTPRYRIGQDGIEAVLKGYLAYDDLDAFVAQIQPPSTAIGNNMVIQYGAPFPGRPNLRVTDIQIDPYGKVGADLDASNFHKCQAWEITITYRFGKITGTGAGTNNPDPVPFLVHHWSIGGQVMSLDHRGLMWDDIRRKTSGGSPEPFFYENVGGTVYQETHVSKRQRVGVSVAQDDKVNAHILIPHILHSISWNRVPRPPFTYIKQAAGKVNQFEMNFQTGKIPPECLLFEGAEINQTLMTNGEISWNLTYRFSERQVKTMDQDEIGGWNHYFRSNKSAIVNFKDGPGALDKIGAIQVPPTVGTPPTMSSQGYPLDSTNDYYACTNLPGFYRLELNPGDASDTDEPCIVEENDPQGNPTKISLLTGYHDGLAIVKKYPFANLFLPEPLPPPSP